MCKLLSFVQTSSYACSVIILTIITLERYLAISCPLQNRRYSHRRRLRTVIASCVWTVSAAYAAPLLFVYDLRTAPPSETFCARVQVQLNVTTYYVMVDFVALYAIPLAMMTVVYVKIAVALWRSSSKQGSSSLAQGETGQGQRRPGRGASDPGLGWWIRRLRDHPPRGGSLRARTWVGDAVDARGIALLNRARFAVEASAARTQLTTAGGEYLPNPGGRKRRTEVEEKEEEYNSEAAAPSDKPRTYFSSVGVERRRDKVGGCDCGVFGCRRPSDAAVAADDEDGEAISCISSGDSNVLRPSEMQSQFTTTFGSRLPVDIGPRSSRNPLIHRRKVVRLLMTMVGSFAVCMLPHHIRLQWQEWSANDNFNETLLYLPPITSLIFFFNSALNPFLYALISDRFRQSLAEIDWCMLRRLKCPFTKRSTSER